MQQEGWGGTYDRPVAAAQPPKPSYWPLGGYAPGHYMGTCSTCGEKHVADKRAHQCLDCAVAWAKHEMAKATLERNEARNELLDLKTRRDTLFNKIAHGDEKHREWLRNAIDEHFGLINPLLELIDKLESYNCDEGCLNGTPMIPLHRDTVTEIIARLKGARG